ncbi:ATP-binding protein [Brevibacillus sp. DP1.3A]|uniref:ATP-binding protein n=1 Tax=Brevibacillus sp. DP1.3A TaxID=2738867 RepID=UPI00156BB11C|nr:ATP-binding protein [Brevibacillus sp. DP1.3A]UED74753.1 ATP-binding protein [Brevibacillus sp. DP1.3A]
MKRYVLPFVSSLVAITFVTGCISSSDQLTVKDPTPPATENTGQPPADATKGEKPADDLLKQFTVLAAQAKEAKELTAFLDQHLAKTDTKTADQLFWALEQYYEKHLPTINDNFKTLLAQPGNADKLYALQYPYDFNKLEGDDSFKQWLLNQTEGGLVLQATNDMSFYWQVDYKALQKYASSLGEEGKDYLSIQETETGKPYLEDGGLQITRAELGPRMVEVEEYLVDYRSSPRAVKLRTLYIDYLKAYLSNYRYETIDEATMKLLPAVKKEYQNFAKKYEATKTGQIVKDYLSEVAKDNDVIFEPGKPGEGIIGDVKPNISQFLNGLEVRIARTMNP